MIGTLLGKIGNLFEKDFLLGSFLPALLFWSAVCLPIFISLGVLPLFAYVETLTTAEKTLSVATAGIFVTTFAYLLNALRPTQTRVWCGDSHWFFLKGFEIVGTAWQRFRMKRIKRRTARSEEIWRTTFTNFSQQVMAVWHSPGAALPQNEERRLLRVISGLVRSGGPAQALTDLAPVIAAFSAYDGNQLVNIFAGVKNKLFYDWWANLRQEIQDEKALLDRSFGTETVILPTRLGNYIQSYNYYPFKRYGIEPEIFWHRLTRVMKKEDLEAVEDQRTLLDFALTMASLSVIYLSFAVIVGPYLWFNTLLWSVLGLASLLSIAFFYQLGIIVTRDLGDRIRSSFDLNRLAMLKALGCVMPRTYAAEKRIWEELSRLAVYGNMSGDLDIAPPPANP